MSTRRRLLLLAEGHSADAHHGKTALGLVRYRREQVVAILDSERAGGMVEGIPVVASVNDALDFDPTVALVGIAPAGGSLPPAWHAILHDCIASGLEVESGLHEFVADDPDLAELARRHGVALRDLRRPPAGLDVPSGANLTHDAAVVLTVGSDCAVGKMTVALELDAEARRLGVASVFVPTGQTGIAIAGWGISVDGVVADFLAGAAERLVLEAVAGGGRLLFVEGQGSLLHPAYSGVSLGLLHGAAPHALVLCHIAGQRHVEGHPEVPIPPLAEVVSLHERSSLISRPARVVAIALNTSRLGPEEAREALAQAREETALPVGDPLRFGAGELASAALAACASTLTRSTASEA